MKAGLFFSINYVIKNKVTEKTWGFGGVNCLSPQCIVNDYLLSSYGASFAPPKLGACPERSRGITFWPARQCQAWQAGYKK